MLSLPEIFRTKLIPWSQQNAGERFIIARREMRQADMPYGVQLTPHKIQAQRVIVKNKRVYNNVRNIIAEWPEAGLHELGKHVIVCVLDGYVDYTLGNYKVKCGPGHFIFIPSGLPRPDGSRPYADLEKSTSCDTAFFLLHPNALECWTSHYHTWAREENNHRLVLHEHTVALLRALAEESINGKPQPSQIGEKLLNLFFEVLLREIEAGRFQKIRATTHVKPKAVVASQADFLTRLELYVQANLQRQLTLKVVSSAMYFSPAQFTRTVRRETGKSFHEYLAEQRIAEARELLRSTDWTVITIASMVGIKSHNHFRTFFKRHTGLTPTEFRLNELQKTKK